MKKITGLSFLLFTLLLPISSCSDFSKNFFTTKGSQQTQVQAPQQVLPQKTKKLSSTKKTPDAKKINSKDISGTLANGTLYEATPDEEGYVVSFDPFIAGKDDIFMSATSQVITKLYGDHLKGESHISIESKIDYAIFTGIKRRYKIIPYKEHNGDVSSLSISSI